MRDRLKMRSGGLHSRIWSFFHIQPSVPIRYQAVFLHILKPAKKITVIPGDFFVTRGNYISFSGHWDCLRSMPNDDVY